MPGHAVTPVNQEQAEKLRCCCCNLILRKAQQSRRTAEKLCCDTCKTPGSDDDYWHDRGIDREVRSLAVYCTNRNEGCLWEGNLERFYEEHLPVCERKFKEDLKDKNKHLMQENNSLKLVLANKIPCSTLDFYSQAESLEDESVKSIIPVAEMARLSLKEDLVPEAKREFGSDQPLTKTSPQPLSQAEPCSDKFDELLAIAKKGVEDLRESHKQKDAVLDQNAKDLERLSKLQDAHIRRSSLLKSYGLPPSKAREFSVAAAPQEFRNKLFWEVPQFLEQRQKALATPRVPLISPPWFCQRGYRMQTYLYLNGINHFKGSHISVMISFVRGPYDNFLGWPAIGNVTFSLLDPLHKNRYLWSKTLSLPNAFHQPTEEVSSAIDAAGCLDFLQLKKLDRYVKDNSLYMVASFKPPLT